ncbi:Hypothetical predicted protein [Lecanosticta acicola]|uniref:Uncharacterized protein n=1 Tax=Lecanosticta acicola TaxID=111012 RepID=A0AAI8YUI7_9PEZI|nr:Hypothetical predicted protein [Lecanosticta acicola]
MRFFDISATALVAAAAVFHGASAAAPDTYDQAAAPPSYNSWTSATTTYTTTRTVLRVVETLTATRNGTTSAYTSTSSSTVPIMAPTGTGSIMTFSNRTSTVLGTGAGPTGTGASSSSGYIPPPQQTGAAGKLGAEAVGLAAIAGIIGLAAL